MPWEHGKIVDEWSFVIDNFLVQDSAIAHGHADGEVDGFIAIPVGFSQIRQPQNEQKREEDEQGFVFACPVMKFLEWLR